MKERFLIGLASAIGCMGLLCGKPEGTVNLFSYQFGWAYADWRITSWCFQPAIDLRK